MAWRRHKGKRPRGDCTRGPRTSGRPAQPKDCVCRVLYPSFLCAAVEFLEAEMISHTISFCIHACAFLLTVFPMLCFTLLCMFQTVLRAVWAVCTWMFHRGVGRSTWPDRVASRQSDFDVALVSATLQFNANTMPNTNPYLLPVGIPTGVQLYLTHWPVVLWTATTSSCRTTYPALACSYKLSCIT